MNRCWISQIGIDGLDLHSISMRYDLKDWADLPLEIDSSFILRKSKTDDTQEQHVTLGPFSEEDLELLYYELYNYLFRRQNDSED